MRGREERGEREKCVEDDAFWASGEKRYRGGKVGKGSGSSEQKVRKVARKQRRDLG